MFSSKIYVGPLFPIRWAREVTGIYVTRYFVLREHRETSELDSGPPARQRANNKQKWAGLRALPAVSTWNSGFLFFWGFGLLISLGVFGFAFLFKSLRPIKLAKIQECKLTSSMWREGHTPKTPKPKSETETQNGTQGDPTHDPKPFAIKHLNLYRLWKAPMLSSRIAAQVLL